HPEKGELPLDPLLAPIEDHGSEEAAVELIVGGSGVGLALIPDDSANAVIDERGDHAVVQAGGGMGMTGRTLGLPRRARYGPPGGFRGGRFLFPLGERLVVLLLLRRILLRRFVPVVEIPAQVQIVEEGFMAGPGLG